MTYNEAMRITKLKQEVGQLQEDKETLISALENLMDFEGLCYPDERDIQQAYKQAKEALITVQWQ